MKIAPRILLAAMVALSALAAGHVPFAAAQAAKQAPKDPVASPALKKEFAVFIAKFRAAVKANDVEAVAALTRLPFMNDAATGDAAKFRAKLYPDFFTKKVRACLLKSKPVYDRDPTGTDNFFIFCGESIFEFTKTEQGFLFSSIGAND